MRWVWVVLLATACGRLGFDPMVPPGSTDGRLGDGTAGDGAARDSSLPAGLVVWFPMEEMMPVDTLTGTVGDCAGTTCPMVIAGYSGNALSFDGSNDCIAIADYTALDQPTLTIALRAFMATSAQDTAIVSKRYDIGAASYNSWELGAGAVDSLDVTTTHPTVTNDQISTPNGDLVVGVWQHLAITWDGGMKRVYVDGAMRAQRAIGSGLSYDTHNAYIGCDDNGGLVRFYRGVIDEVQIYNRALSSTEIAALAGI
jgi:hypothetical protein